MSQWRLRTCGIGASHSLCVHSYLYCILAWIKLKDKAQYNIRWESHYPPLAQKSPPHSHNPSLNKFARCWPSGTSRTHLGDWPKGKVIRVWFLSNRCSRLGIERWFGIIRPVSPVWIPPTDLIPTWPINLWPDSDNIPLVDSLTSYESSRSKLTLA